MMIDNNYTHTYTTFSDPIGVYSTYGNAINAGGQVAGRYVDGNGVLQVLLYSNGKYSTLNGPLGKAAAAEDNNDEGQIVGQYADSSNGVGNGSLYSKVDWRDDHGHYTTLDDPNGDPALGGTSPNGINDRGQIVGSYTDSSGGGHGFLLSNGQYTTLDDSLGDPAQGGTLLVGINNKGRIVGFYMDSSGAAHSFVYDNGHFTTLDDPNADPAQGGTFLGGNNNKGQMVGSYTDSSGAYHGFLYSDGHFTTLDYPLGTLTFAEGINDQGQVVGQYRDSKGIYHGFLYSDSHFTTLDVPLDIGSAAIGINDQGQIAGGYTDSSGFHHGFLYSKGYYGNRYYTTLDDPLASGVEGGTGADGINDKGQIVGCYADSTGAGHGFLLHRHDHRDDH